MSATKKDSQIEDRLFRIWAKDWKDDAGESIGYNIKDHYVQQAIDIMTGKRSFSEEMADKWYKDGQYSNACRAERRVSRINNVLYHMVRCYFGL